MVQYNDLSMELGNTSCRVLGIRGNIATLDISDGDILDIEANIVTRKSLRQRLVVHLHGLDLLRKEGQKERGRKEKDRREREGKEGKLGK